MGSELKADVLRIRKVSYLEIMQFISVSRKNIYSDLTEDQTGS